MAFYHCDTCNHNCRSMQTFTKHIASKKHKVLVEQQTTIIKPLQLQKKYNCIYCNKEYVRQKKYIEHQLKCGSNTSLIQKDNASNKLAQLPQCITNNTNNINNINLTQNNTNNTNTTNNNYFIMPFGKEDLSMISEDKRKYIISRGLVLIVYYWMKCINIPKTITFIFMIKEINLYRLHWACNPVHRYCLYTKFSPTPLNEWRNGLRIQCRWYVT